MLDFLARIIAKSWQEFQYNSKIQNFGKKCKIIQEIPRPWQENQDSRTGEVMLCSVVEFHSQFIKIRRASPVTFNY